MFIKSFILIFLFPDTKLYYQSVLQTLPEDFTYLNEKNIRFIINEMYINIINIGVLDTDYFRIHQKDKIIEFISFLTGGLQGLGNTEETSKVFGKSLVKNEMLKEILITELSNVFEKNINKPIKDLYEFSYKKLCQKYISYYIIFVNSLICDKKIFPQHYQKSSVASVEGRNVICNILIKIKDPRKILLFGSEALNNYVNYLRYKHFFQDKIYKELILMNEFKHFPNDDNHILEYDDNYDYLELYIYHYNLSKILDTKYIIEYLKNKNSFIIEKKILGEKEEEFCRYTVDNIIDNEIDPLLIADIYLQNSNKMNSFFNKQNGQRGMAYLKKIDEMSDDEILDNFNYYLNTHFPHILSLENKSKNIKSIFKITYLLVNNPKIIIEDLKSS